jgi:hypothetical protein
MSLVHVETFQPLVTERGEHSNASYAEHNLLGEAVSFVAAIKVVAQLSVPLRVFRYVRIEKIDRYVVPTNTAYLVLPATQADGSPFNAYRDPLGKLGEKIFYHPTSRDLFLDAVLVQ